MWCFLETVNEELQQANINQTSINVRGVGVMSSHEAVLGKLLCCEEAYLRPSRAAPLTAWHGLMWRVQLQAAQVNFTLHIDQIQADLDDMDQTIDQARDCWNGDSGESGVVASYVRKATAGWELQPVN